MYAGAGSHASYFRPGEYQAEVPIPFPGAVTRPEQRAGTVLAGRRWVRAPRRRTRFASPSSTSRAVTAWPSGRGRRIDGRRKSSTRRHPGRAATAGSGACSRATRSPVRTRRPGRCTSATARPAPSWFDPLGFAALDRVPPPPRELEALEGERTLLQGRQSELERLIPEASARLQELGVRIRSLRGSPHLAAEAERLEALVADEAASLTGLRLERSANAAVLEGLDRRIDQRRQGERRVRGRTSGNAAEPVSVAQMRFDRAAEVWAAISLSAAPRRAGRRDPGRLPTGPGRRSS